MSRMDWRTAGALLLAGVLAYALGLPYTFSLAPFREGQVVLLLLAVVQGAIFLAVAILIGQYFGHPIGLGAPVVSDAVRGAPVADRIRSLAPLALGSGAAVGMALLAIDVGLVLLRGDPLAVAALPPLWTRVLVTAYGGVVEEILLRYGVMTLFVWIAWRVAGRPDALPSIGVWVAIVLSSVAFGLGHLPIAAAAGATITPYLLARTILLNGVAGIVFGWLYWRRGLLAAMLSHFTADVVLHVIGLTILAAVL
ncbi:MAG: CPBP family intramembrane glutamic endopeptidase [Halanaeroarchaeum sp.]